MRQAIEETEIAIGNLRAIITDMRPAALDDLWLRAALNALTERHRRDDLIVVADDHMAPSATSHPSPASTN